MAKGKYHKRVAVEAELVEFICPNCDKGVLRVDEGKRPGITWAHKCTRCEYECEIAAPFPMILYKGEKFILDKHVPRPSPKPYNSSKE